MLSSSGLVTHRDGERGGRPSHYIKRWWRQSFRRQGYTSAVPCRCAATIFIEPIACTPASGWEKGQVETRSGWCASPSSRRGCASEATRSSTLGCSPNVLPTPRRTGIPEWTIGDVFEDERRKLVDYCAPFDRFHAVRRGVKHLHRTLRCSVVGRRRQSGRETKGGLLFTFSPVLLKASMCEIRHTDAHVSCRRGAKCRIFSFPAQPLRWHVDCKVTVRSRGPDELVPPTNQPRAMT